MRAVYPYREIQRRRWIFWIYVSLGLVSVDWSTTRQTALGAEAQQTSQLSGGALAGDRPRVIVSTDVGGSDPDDFQSMVHLLLYADVLALEGFVSSPPYAGRAEHLLEVIDAYEQDFPRLQQHSDEYPSPEVLRSRVKQGAIDPAPASGWSRPTEGSQWMIYCAQKATDRPLWILVWGSITDVAQAVHDDPSIEKRIRVYSIGSWNTKNDRAARDYLASEHVDLWWIESNTTFRGMYLGGRQDGEWGNREFVQQYVRGHGALGELLVQKKDDIKMGDTPSVLYLLRGDPDNPVGPHWGGAFMRTTHGPNYWTDRREPDLAEGNFPGAKTVNCWRCEYLTDWRQRTETIRQPSSSTPNSPK